MNATATLSSDITLDSLAGPDAGIVLRRGDNDTRRVWGGKQQTGRTGSPVGALQEALRRVGAAAFKPDGDFGPQTDKALRRFQWYVTRMNHRLRVPPGSDDSQGLVEPFATPSGVRIDGFAKPSTLSELTQWQRDGFVTSSPLVRLGLVPLAHTGLGDEFTVLAYPSPAADEMLVHQDFAAVARRLDILAGAAAVTLSINQSFRVQGMPPTGAVVAPASNSQHLIGHAVDLNIVDAGTVNTSNMFKQGKQTAAAKDFIRQVKNEGVRWGGDFGVMDPPHFDDFVLPSSDEYEFSFYFAQRSYALRHALRTV